MLRDRVRQFAGAEIDRDNVFPADLWRKSGVLGLHGMTSEIRRMPIGREPYAESL